MNGRDPLRHRLDALAVRVQEVGAWRDRHRFALPGLRATDAEGETPVAVGDPWPVRDVPTTFTAAVEAPDPAAGAPLELVADVGGEALLRVDGVARGGLNPFHDRVLLTDACRPGDRWDVTIEAVPYGPFGRRIARPHVERFEAIVPDADVRAFHEDLLAILDGARTHVDLGNRDLAARLVRLLRRALVGLPVPRTPTGAYLARIGPTFSTDATGDRGGLEALWEGWTFRDAPLQLSAEHRADWAAAQRVLADGLAELHADAPSTGALIATGHAHLDLAWLWPIAETRRKAVRTFASVLDAMDRHPDYRFGQSMAQLYAWLEVDEPELFERLRDRVAEGRWEVAGGMWVEPDGNLPSGEAWVRQLLHGQRWFASRFGAMPRVGWLPDTFGYAGNLPQLLRQAGLDGFFTTKLEWNDTNRFPYDLYRWEGIDGTRVLAHQVTNPSGGYNGSVDGGAAAATWENFRGKEHHRVSLYPFGHGDGGGGPDEAMLERLPRLVAFPGLPALRPGRIDDFFESADVPGLPVWRGEQYLELHRGTYTSQARLKRLDRRLEHALVEAEAAATLDGARRDDPRGRRLHELWTVLLRNQFHDILPGSSIRTVVAEAENELSEALRAAEEVRAEALARLSSDIDASAFAARDRPARLLVMWNLSLDPRPLRAELPLPAEALGPSGDVRLRTPDDREVAWQATADGIVVDDPDAVVPPMGYLALSVTPAGDAAHMDPASAHPASVLEVAPDRLANARLEVRIAEDGTLAALIDRAAGRNLLAGPGDRLIAYPDLPRFFEAWEMDPDDAEGAVALRLQAPPEVVEEGPLRAAVRLRRGTDGLRVVQDLRLTRHGDRLEIATRIDVHGRRLLLKSLTTLDVRSDTAAFETAFGTVERPTHRNTSWDAARFEVPGHRWADLSDGRGGVALSNDGRYGHSVEGGTLGLTLVRAPIHPDPFADEGRHEVTYALRPHPAGDRAATVASAHDLNAPLLGVVTAPAGGAAPATRSLLGIEGAGLRLAALKPAEDDGGAVLRLYESAGRPTRGRIRNLPPGWTLGPRVDLLERTVERLDAADGFDVRGFGVVSVRFDRRGR